MQQALSRFLHHQRGHQVLEHGSRPRLEPGGDPDGQKSPAERHPVAAGCIALGDRQKAGQTGLRCQQVVVAGVQAVLVDAKTNVKQMALVVVKTRKIHAQT